MRNYSSLLDPLEIPELIPSQGNSPLVPNAKEEKSPNSSLREYRYGKPEVDFHGQEINKAGKAGTNAMENNEDKDKDKSKEEDKENDKSKDKENDKGKDLDDDENADDGFHYGKPGDNSMILGAELKRLEADDESSSSKDSNQGMAGKDGKKKKKKDGGKAGEEDEEDEDEEQMGEGEIMLMLPCILTS